MLFFASDISNENFSLDDTSEGLHVKIMAVTPGVFVPIRNKSGQSIATVRVTEEMIKDTISSFNGSGYLNVNHKPDTKIGSYNLVEYKDGYYLSGSVTCPTWAEKIRSNDGISGISIEGSISGSISDPKINILGVSFLTTLGGGACGPSNGCEVKILNDNPKIAASQEDDLKIEASWSPNYDAFWSYSETDGKINQSKAKKIFLKKTGDGSNRGDWHFPVAKITENGPEDSDEGLMAAYKRAAQQDETALFSKIRARMKKINMEIPEGLKASRTKLEASYDKESGKFSAKILDEDDEILSEKEIQIPIINDLHVKGVELIMSENVEEIKVEANIPTPEPVVVEAAAPTSSPEAIVEAAVIPEAPVIAPVVEVAPEVPVTEPRLDFWEMVSEKLGIKTQEEFTQIKTAAEKSKEIEANIATILKENEELKAFKIDKQKAMLKDLYPPALTKNIDAFYQDYVKDPLEFTQKYTEDAQRFSASKNVTLAGSAVESKETEETRKMAERVARRDSFLSKTGGPIRR